MAETDAADDRTEERDEAEQAPQERISAREAANRAMAYVAEMTGEEPEIAIAVEPDDDRWLVRLEMLELARVPSTTDVLGCYEVEMSFEGEPLAYRRVRRYHRGGVGVP